MKQPERSNLHSGLASPFGLLLKGAREAAGLSQAQLAAEIGVSRPYVSRLEQGTHANPSAIFVNRAAARLNVSIGDFLYALAGNPPSETPPSCEAYLRVTHPDWPEAVVQELVDFYTFIRERHSLR